MAQLKIVPISPCANIPAMLRKLADEIEEGAIICDRVTLIAGREVRCFGPVDDARAAEQAIFDMTWGIHRLMSYPAMVALDEDGL